MEVLSFFDTIAIGFSVFGRSLLYHVPKYFNLFKEAVSHYANWDQNTLIFAPTPDAAYTVELWYNKTPDRLSSTNTTTWLSTNAPEILIYGVVGEAFSYLKNPTYVQLYDQKYSQAVQGLSVTQMGRKRRDEYADGVLRVPLQSVAPGGK